MISIAEKQNIIELEFMDWTFLCDNTRTESLYKSILCGKSAYSKDPVLKKYQNHPEHYFPSKVLNLFYYLNIDTKKDAKIYTYKNEDGFDVIEGSFYFVGKLKGGNSCKIELSDDHYVYELHPITENFSIGFYEEQETKFNEEIVWVEFNICLDDISPNIRL